MRRSSTLGLLAVVALAGCVSESTSPGPSTAPVATLSESRDPIIGKWRVEPAVSTGTDSCTVTFSAGIGGNSGRVSPFACHQVSGLGGLHGFADVNKWARDGDTITLSGIAQPGIGTVYLSRNGSARRAGGVVDDGIRFTLVRQ